MRTSRIITASFAAGVLLLAPACSDEDGDGATTDEELQDLEDTGDSLGEELDEEVEGQSTGTDDDGE